MEMKRAALSLSRYGPAMFMDSTCFSENFAASLDAKGSYDTSNSHVNQTDTGRLPDPQRSAMIATKQAVEPPMLAGMGVGPIAQENFLAAAIPPPCGPSRVSIPFAYASDSFINQLFPTTSAPIDITNVVFSALAKAGYWNSTTSSFQITGYSEQAMGEWLNAVGTTMGGVYGRSPDRLWWHGTCNLPPASAPHIPRKPDLVLLTREHQQAMVANPQPFDCIRIRSFAEVTESPMPSGMIPTIIAKSYVLFRLQFDRRFSTALSFDNSGEYSFTLTDREGQIRYLSSLQSNGLEPAQRFLTILSFLMFGRDSDIGLDPHFVRDPNSDRLTAVHVENSRYELDHRIYSVKLLFGRGTNVWIVTRDSRKYVLKDSWVLEHSVESEISHLKAMVGHPQLESLVPAFENGGDIMIDGVTDSTANYRGSGVLGRPGKQRVHRRSIVSPVGAPLTNFRSKKEFVGALMDVVAAHKYLCETLKILHADISIGNIMLHQPKQNERATGLLIDFDFAKTIKDINDGVLVGSGRDMSNTDSKLVDDEGLPSAGQIDSIDTRAFIGTEVDGKAGLKGGELTGTPPFIAIEGLLAYPEPFNQGPCHDLESILYIILYFCTYFKGPGMHRTSTDFPEMHSIPLDRFFQRDGSLRQFGRTKCGLLVTAERSLLAKFTPYWADFVPFVRRLIQTCFPNLRDLRNRLTHDNVTAILLEAYNVIEEPGEPVESPMSSPRKRRKLNSPEGDEIQEI